MALAVPTVWAGVGELFAYQYPGGSRWTTPYRLTSNTFVAMGRRPRPAGAPAETGTSSVNLNVPLSTPAWTMTDLTDHWSTPKLRGDDLAIPYGVGELARPRQVGSTEFSVTVAVNGDYLPDGTLTTRPETGLARNIENLRMLQPNVYPGRTPAGWEGYKDDGLREFWFWELHYPDYQPVYSGLVQVERVRVTREARTLAYVVLSLTAAVPLDSTSSGPLSAWPPAIGTGP
jgi:hypothetical protein